MSYLVLARKWRPQLFEEVIGQEHVTRTLTNAIRQNRIAHAYLFAGPRGVGKTTTARLLAKALNCEKGPAVKSCNHCSSCEEIARSSSLDVVEIDGASNRGIDEIRSLRENIKFAPSRDRFKIYIVDEVHMLTPEAFNALLKTLEEPPEHVKFIFATTAPHRVLPTILSRCQRFDFKRITVSDLIERLKLIVREEKLQVEEKAFFAIARGVEGSMRDALSLLDQLISFSEGKIRVEEVNAVLGMVDEETFFSLVEAMIAGNTLSGIKLIDTVISQGKDLRLFSTNLMEHFRNLMMCNVGGEAIALIDLPGESLERLQGQSRHFNLQEIEEAVNILSRTAEALKWTESGRIPLELAIIKLTKMKTAPSRDPEENPPEQNPAPAATRKAAPKGKPPEGEPVLASPVIEPENSSVEKVEKEDGNTLSLETVKEKWPRVLERIKEKKITAEAYLREGRPTKVSEKMLTVTFAADFKFHKESVERNDIRRVIEGVLRDILQHDLMLRPVLDRASSSGKKKAAASETQNGEDELNKLLEKEPMMKTALETFGARVVEVKAKEG